MQALKKQDQTTKVKGQIESRPGKLEKSMPRRVQVRERERNEEDTGVGKGANKVQDWSRKLSSQTEERVRVKCERKSACKSSLVSLSIFRTR